MKKKNYYCLVDINNAENFIKSIYGNKVYIEESDLITYDPGYTKCHFQVGFAVGTAYFEKYCCKINFLENGSNKYTRTEYFKPYAELICDLIKAQEQDNKNSYSINDYINEYNEFLRKRTEEKIIEGDDIRKVIAEQRKNLIDDNSCERIL